MDWSKLIQVLRERWILWGCAALGMALPLLFELSRLWMFPLLFAGIAVGLFIEEHRRPWRQAIVRQIKLWRVKRNAASVLINHLTEDELQAILWILQSQTKAVDGVPYRPPFWNLIQEGLLLPTRNLSNSTQQLKVNPSLLLARERILDAVVDQKHLRVLKKDEPPWHGPHNWMA